MAANLVTLVEYKAYLGISSNTNDTITNSLIPAVSELVKTLCRRTFVDYVTDSKVEVLRGGPVLILTESPLLEVTSVEYSSDYGNTYISLTEYTDYATDVVTEQIIPINSINTFPICTNGYRVSYTAGYPTLPPDLKLAVFDLITYYLRNDAAVHSTKAVGANKVQIEYITNTHMPAHIKRVLDLYTASYN